MELFLNGRSLGSKNTNSSCEYIARWIVPYKKGELVAVGYNGKKKIATTVLRSAESASSLVTTADRKNIKTDGQDLSYITVELKDKNGTTLPKAENKITFTVDGPGSIAGVGNAHPMSVESFQLPERKLWRGKCLVIIKARKESGPIKLTVNTEGLPPAVITIN